MLLAVRKISLIDRYSIAFVTLAFTADTLDKCHVKGFSPDLTSFSNHAPTYDMNTLIHKVVGTIASRYCRTLVRGDELDVLRAPTQLCSVQVAFDTIFMQR
jgi:hypothetical protein